MGSSYTESTFTTACDLKDIMIQEFSPKTELPRSMEERMEISPGMWRNLLEGKTVAVNFEEWWPGTWTLDNGALTATTNNAMGWLFTKEDYSDFIFEAEYRTSKGGGGGIAIRFPFPPEPDKRDAWSFQLGYEINIFDTKEHTIQNPSGSLYNLARAYVDHSRPGNCNRLVIYALRDHITVWLNRYKASEIHDTRSRRGRIGFQAFKNGHTIQYRNVRIKEIDPDR